MLPPTYTSWFDDDGELTELSDSEDEDEPEIPPSPPVRPSRTVPATPALTRSKPTRPSTQSATQKSRARNGLKENTPYLKPHRTVTYSVSALHDWLDQGLVDLEAEYQRGIVWSETKQMNLIDSIFHNFYIPPIVFAVERGLDGSERRICIDGKQRLTSIHRFSKGDIAHKDPTTNRKSYFTNPPESKKRKLITSQMQANFKNKQLACVEYDDLTPELERDIFQRVQFGVPLAPADRLPAINGAHADLVRRLRNRIDTTTGFEKYLEWGKARGKDFQALAQIVYLIVNGQQSRKAEPQTSRLEAFLAGGDDTTALQETAYNVMDIFCRIVGDRELGRPLHHKLSPLEMVMSGYLISLYRRKLSDTQLSDAIEYMRMDIKTSASEPRFNTQNFKQLLNFVLKVVPKLIPSLKTGPMGEKPAFQVPYRRMAAPARSVKESSVGLDSASSSFDTISKSGKTTAKRKHPVASEKEDNADSDSDLLAPAKKAPRKSESNHSPGRKENPSGSGSTGSRLGLLKQPTNVKSSPARTTIRTKKNLPTGSPRASTSIPNIPPISAARSSVSTANTKLGAQVAKPSVKPPSAARIPATSSHHTGAPLHSPLSNGVDNPTSLGSAPLLASNSSTSNPVPRIPAPVPKPPLPGRRRLPRALSVTVPTASPVEQDFHLPSAPNGTAMPEAASLFDPDVRLTGAEDLGGGLAPQNSARNGNATLPAAVSASTGSSSSGLPPSSSINAFNTTSRNKLPNIKFKKKNSLSEQTPIPVSASAVNEAQWQADTGALLNSIVVGSNPQPSQPPLPSSSTPSPLKAPRNPQVSPNSSSPMVCRQVLAPQPPARSNPGGGVHNPGRPVTPMMTPSPTCPHLQPTRASGAGVPSPSSVTASGFSPPGNGRPIPTGSKNMSSSSNCANGSNAPDARFARMDAQAQLMAAHRARNASQTLSYPAASAMPTPPMPSPLPRAMEDVPTDASKRPRANREAMQRQARHGYESVDGDEQQQQQQQQAAKRGRSCSGGGRQDS